MEGKTVLSRTSSFFRPWSFTYGYKDYKVDQIIFYADGKILYDCGRGWLEDSRLGNYKGDVWSLIVPALKKGVRENLNRDDCYFITGERKWRTDDGYKVYINVKAAGITVEKGKTTKGWSSPTENHYHTELTIKGLDGRYESDKCTSITTSIYSHKKERKQAKRIGEVKDRLAKVFSNVSDYDVEKFLKEFPEVKYD